LVRDLVDTFPDLVLVCFEPNSFCVPTEIFGRLSELEPCFYTVKRKLHSISVILNPFIPFPSYYY